MTFLSSLYNAILPYLGLLQLLVTTVLFLFAVRSTYRAFTGPLTLIPGSFISRWTDLPVRWRVVTGTKAQYIHSLHQRYGPVVRLSPTDVDVCDVDAVRQVHRARAPFIKSKFYVSPAGFQSMFSTRDVACHAQRRRMLGPYFNETFLRTIEEPLAQIIQTAVNGIVNESRSTGCADALKWWTLMALDVIGELSFGESFGLTQGGVKTPYVENIALAGFLIPLWAAFPILAKISQQYTSVPYFSNGFNRLRSVLFTQKDRVSRYLERINADDPRREKTLFEAIVQKGSSSELSVMDATIETQSYVTAGTDTTAVTLTYLMWAVCQNKAVKERLVRELASLPEPLTYAYVRDSPYLNCVVNETLRLYGAASGVLPRDAPDTGVELSGHYIPANVTVTTQSYSIHRNPSVFPDPEKFDPSRWENATKEMKDSFMPFSIGPRSCVGQHLAGTELRLATAMLFRAAPGLHVSTKHGMSDDDMVPLTAFLIAPKGHRCLVEV